ncbi:Gldg family protein [Thermococcus sp. ES12]|uniref:Gldg family protein n=1 Tax=Thermococcus sp. ES12 TaxID=1638246 RepID=UPI0014314496|nr:Gldg family protein [Thermococcus sp. ES12]NJE75905.1 hypothetical protein [Thermococcus sp. ES12]
MKKSALILALILVLSLIPAWAIKPVQAQRTIIPIAEIQGHNDSSPYDGQIVTTRGVVTFVTKKGFFIQNGTGPWSGIYVYVSAWDYLDSAHVYPEYLDNTPIQVGDFVEVQGEVDEYNKLTELEVYWDGTSVVGYITKLGEDNVPEPELLATVETMREQWESVLVKVVDAKITNRIDDDHGNTILLIDDGSGEAKVFFKDGAPKELQAGAKFKYLIGAVSQHRDDYEIMPKSWELYNPAVKITNIEYYSFIKDAPSKVKVTVFNNGTNSSNVTFTVKLDNAVVYSEDFILQSEETKIVKFYVIPTSIGEHVLTIITEESEKILTINVIPNPYQLSYGLTPYYERLYSKEMTNITSLYENLTWVVGKLQACGVNLGDLEPKVQWINKTMSEIEREYYLYDTLKGLLVQQNPYRSAYYYPVMMHIRKAAMMSRDILKEIESVLPILQSTYEQVKPICHPPAPAPSNETTPGNETPANQTNVTPSTNVIIRVTRVLIDASHGQYYVKKVGISNLTDKIQSELGWEVEINRLPLTYDHLNNYDIVILLNPKDDFTEAEISGIQQFVEEGGGLFIAGDWYKYLNAESLNAVVEKYGIKFNPDELMDEEKNSGRPYYPFIGLYNREHPAMKFVPEDWTMYYNGDTLEISGSAVWLIRGYETSYSVDSEGNTVYEKGSKPVIAAAVEIGQGRIVAYGSSKAISDAYYGNYINTNWPFVKGVLLWLAHQE